MSEWLAKPRVVARASKARVLISVYSGKPSASDMHTCNSRLSKQTCNSRLSKHTRNSRLSKSGMFQGCESTQVGQFLNRAATDWAVRLGQTEASAKVGEQCDEGQAELVNRSADWLESLCQGSVLAGFAGGCVTQRDSGLPGCSESAALEHARPATCLSGLQSHELSLGLPKPGF
ncbi:MAG TPA: hypothetical protein VFX23_09900 [Limnobacter sp.]|uniref:hypothetical protein n=1 Tax=Limnobacter sp. TaxID=2003368 RepID=UPI002E2F22F8|nr:hypothetical protein [Limnobacter sp.]HEX5486301.1 hypothetical protein [Limnobacter sp.]